MFCISAIPVSFRSKLTLLMLREQAVYDREFSSCT